MSTQPAKPLFNCCDPLRLLLNQNLAIAHTHWIYFFIQEQQHPLGKTQRLN